MGRRPRNLCWRPTRRLVTTRRPAQAQAVARLPEEKVRAVKNLARTEAWSTTGSADEELEDAREVADAVRQVCQRMKKGKARP